MLSKKGIAQTKSAVVLIMTMIGINLALLGFARLNIGFKCPELDEGFQSGNETLTWNNIKDMALGRCEGLPFWLVILIEAPLIAGILFLAREFLGFT